ncbi:MAG TPA: prepilin-type N-terminal cleavage/methylation domain-containing protein [Kiritimatiellia bacterium]|nr:prepilin-type N-terminal cleavage/methylation domain-containing protein [Kiritimatiellia bacterium]
MVISNKLSKPKRRAGLTLVEVILAVAILGIGLTALVTAASRTLHVLRQAKNLDTARELFGLLEATKPIQLEDKMEDAAGSGTFPRPYQNYRWTRDVEIVGDEEDGLWQLIVSIMWTENNRPRKETVHTYVFWPEEVQGGTFERRP